MISTVSLGVRCLDAGVVNQMVVVVVQVELYIARAFNSWRHSHHDRAEEIEALAAVYCPLTNHQHRRSGPSISFLHHSRYRTMPSNCRVQDRGDSRGAVKSSGTSLFSLFFSSAYIESNATPRGNGRACNAFISVSKRRNCGESTLVAMTSSESHC